MSQDQKITLKNVYQQMHFLSICMGKEHATMFFLRYTHPNSTATLSFLTIFDQGFMKTTTFPTICESTNCKPQSKKK